LDHLAKLRDGRCLLVFRFFGLEGHLLNGDTILPLILRGGVREVEDLVLSLPVLVGPFTNDPPGLTTIALLLQDSPRDLGLHHELLPLASGPFLIGALILHDRPHLLGELGCV